MKEYIKLLRIKHYIKNLLIFIPMFFGGALFDFNKLTASFNGCSIFIFSKVVVFDWHSILFVFMLLLYAEEVKNSCSHHERFLNKL